jgi:hypothetical protein
MASGEASDGNVRAGLAALLADAVPSRIPAALIARGGVVGGGNPDGKGVVARRSAARGG